MNWPAAVLGLILAGVASAEMAEELPCEQIPELAEEFQEMRDVDAAKGLEQASRTLDALRDQAVSCPEGEALLLRAMTSNLQIMGSSERARIRIEEALALLDEMDAPPPDVLAPVHLTAGVVHWELEAHDSAISHYERAREFSEAAGNARAAAQAAGNIGNLYNTLGRYERSVAYHRQALEEFRAMDDRAGMAGTHVNLAAAIRRIAERNRSDGDELAATEAYQAMHAEAWLALELFDALENPRGVAYAANNIAIALEGMERPEEALEYHRKSLELNRQVGDRTGALQVFISKSDTYRQLGRIDDSLNALQQAESKLTDEHLGKAASIARRQVELAEDRGDYQEALEYQREVTGLRRQIAEEQMSARVEEVRMAMQAEQREQELALLRSEAEVSELQLRRQRTTITAAVLLLVAVAVMLALLYGRYRTRVHASHQLDHAARTDPLTGISNRRDMLERLKVAREECRHSGRAYSIILGDIDDFKQVNDTHGHAVGDEVLGHFARALADMVKGRDVVSRWGGEEFLLLLPDTDLVAARAVAENLRREVARNPAETAVGAINLTMSLGVAAFAAERSVDEVIQLADQAMYAAKQAGKNRVCLAGEKQ